jgi:hypothetical protein
MKKIIVRLAGLLMLNAFCFMAQAQKEFYEIRQYKMKTAEQIGSTENYLRDAFLPALHRLGIQNIGVFKPIANDTAAVKLLFVLVPYGSLDIWQQTKNSLETDPVYTVAARAIADADTSHYPFTRMESTLLEAFPDQLRMIPTTLKSNPDAIYELRSYESPSEELHRTKVRMFNAGGEIPLFKRLDFQAIFYADVLSGCRMPNLMYMIVFANMTAHDEHWKAFGGSPEWKQISTDPQYRNKISVNHIDSWLMRRASYSDL